MIVDALVELLNDKETIKTPHLVGVADSKTSEKKTVVHLPTGLLLGEHKCRQICSLDLHCRCTHQSIDEDRSSYRLQYRQYSCSARPTGLGPNEHHHVIVNSLLVLDQSSVEVGGSGIFFYSTTPKLR